MDITEIIDVLQMLKIGGCGDEKLFDDNDQHFAISNIFVNQFGKIVFECDEVK